LEAVVDGLAWAAVLTRYLPVFEPGDDVLDPGSDAAVGSVVAVVDDAAGVVASGCGDRRNAAVAAVTKNVVASGRVRRGVAGHDDVVAVARPASAGDDYAAQMMIWVVMLRR
jgi:hypothetical protein